MKFKKVKSRDKEFSILVNFSSEFSENPFASFQFLPNELGVAALIVDEENQVHTSENWDTYSC